MHGLINQAIENFARETYGDAFWSGIAGRARLGYERFEPMMIYDPQVSRRVLDALSRALDRPGGEVLEDIGTYLVSSSGTGAVRRLLRFSGTDFVDFLHALDDLPARARLAVPELDMPGLLLRQNTARSFTLTIRTPCDATFGFGRVVMGLLRAMADDYGALVYLDYKGGCGDNEVIEVLVLETTFAEARAFDLGAPA